MGHPACTEYFYFEGAFTNDISVHLLLVQVYMENYTLKKQLAREFANKFALSLWICQKINVY